jgi:putative MATE family efflux protein
VTDRTRQLPPIDSAEALGTRPIGRLLWHTCSQTTLSVGIYGVYALTNAWFVARGVGAQALAAVNLVAPVLLLLGAVSTTVGVGGASLVSRALGAYRPQDAARAAGNSFVVFWVVAILATFGGLLAVDPLLTMLGASGQTLDVARPYALVIIAGSVFATGFSAIVRAEGRLFFSTLLWVIPVAVQIVLDPIFIFGLQLGVTGAALGTVGGQAVSAGMAVWFFFIQRQRPYRIGLTALRPDRRIVAAVLTVGAPSFLAGFGAALLVVLVNTSLASAGAAAGAMALAAYAVVARVQTFVTIPQLGITQGIRPIVGYNAGRGLPDRVARTLALALQASLTYGLASSVLVIVGAPWLVGALVTDTATAAAAVAAMRIMALGFVFLGVAPLVSAYFQSLGRAAPSYLVSLGTLALIKVPLVLVLTRFGTLGTWISLPAGELLSAATALAVLGRHRSTGERQVSADVDDGSGRSSRDGDGRRHGV